MVYKKLLYIYMHLYIGSKSPCLIFINWHIMGADYVCITYKPHWSKKNKGKKENCKKQNIMIGWSFLMFGGQNHHFGQE